MALLLLLIRRVLAAGAGSGDLGIMLLKRPILAVVETGVLGLLAGVVLGLLGGVLMVRGLGVLLRPKAGFTVLA